MITLRCYGLLFNLLNKGGIQTRKEDALKILFDCAVKYNENLIGKNLLFICIDSSKKIHSLEMNFLTSNFLHLTGVKFPKASRLSPHSFFDKCLKKRLRITEFEFATDGTTEKKLSVLPLLLSKNLSANMVGDFSARTPVLVTEKLAGNIKGCIGFIYDDRKHFYVPNTVLNLDIRTYISNQQRVIAISYPIEFDYISKPDFTP